MVTQVENPKIVFEKMPCGGWRPQVIGFEGVEQAVAWASLVNLIRDLPPAYWAEIDDDGYVKVRT